MKLFPEGLLRGRKENNLMRDDLRLLFAFFYVRIKVFQASLIKGVLAFGATSHTAHFNFETDFLYKRYLSIVLFKTIDALVYTLFLLLKDFALTVILL